MGLDSVGGALVIHEILSKLGPTDTAAVGCLNERFRDWAADESLWSKFYADELDLSSPQDPLGNPSPTFKELVLRDNRLTKIPDLSIFRRLLVFDVSFNESSLLNGLSTVSNRLKELYVSKNEVSKIEEIDHFHELQILELGSNRLRVMENLQNLTILQELWLGRNRIRAINLCGLKCIKKISLQSNRLTSVAGLETGGSMA